MPIRIAVIANKTWECDPLVSTLLAKDARPPALRNFLRGYDPATPSVNVPLPDADGARTHAPPPVRARLCLDAGSARVEVWCIEDWMRSERRNAEGALVAASASSSFEKLTFALPQIRRSSFGGAGPELVVAFGTAGIPAEATFNGCVAIGSRVYLRNPWAGKPEAEIAAQVARHGPMLDAQLEGRWEVAIESDPKLSRTLFQDISTDARFAAEARFLKPPISACEVPRILAGHGYASLGTVNICDYDDYVWADEETLHSFAKRSRQREIGSMETTHGLIRIAFDKVPFLFVSALTDRVPMFNAEVTPRKYAQNFAAAHNAGVAVAHLLPELARLADAKKLLESDVTQAA